MPSMAAVEVPSTAWGRRLPRPGCAGPGLRGPAGGSGRASAGLPARGLRARCARLSTSRAGDEPGHPVASSGFRDRGRLRWSGTARAVAAASVAGGTRYALYENKFNNAVQAEQEREAEVDNY